MYLPKHFAEPRIEVMHELMRAYPLATLVTFSSSGLDANHIPLQLVADATPFGTLQGHVARANPLWKNAGEGGEAGDVLLIFQGPDAYISPSWYPSKKETGKAVPTWNYAVVHAHGTLRVIDDAGWVRAQIETLTTQHEAALPHPWQVSDAPQDYVEKMVSAIVGIEIIITRLTGKWKVSQNQPAENQAGVVEALRNSGNNAMTELVETRAKAADQ
jgi:transcriptional regulator